jgi:HEAT repeat protein/CHAT domain-containing protein
MQEEASGEIASGERQEEIRSLVRSLRTPGRKNLSSTVSQLANIGAPAVPALLDALNSDLPRNEVLRALVAIGPNAGATALGLALEHPSVNIRLNAAKALAKIEDARPALAGLLVAVRDPMPDVRRFAARALARLGIDAADAALDLASELRNHKTRKAAEFALKAIGAPAVSVVTPLVLDLDSDTSLAAIRVLKKVALVDATSLFTLATATSSTDRQVRESAAAALFSIGPSEKAIRRVFESRFAVSAESVHGGTESRDSPASEMTELLTKLRVIPRESGDPLPPESPRFTDLALYAGDHYDSEDLSQIPTLGDDEPISADSSYTLTVAIRKERVGVDTKKLAPRPVQSHREGSETVEVFVLVKAFFAEIELRDTFAKITWPYDEDSTEACFRFRTSEFFGDTAREGGIEVRLYDKSLDLLDLVVLHLAVLPNMPAGIQPPPAPPRSLSWPDGSPSVVHSQTPPRLASIAVTEKTGGYELEFLFRNAADAEVHVPFFRGISTGDLERLLARVRDFWTSLVISNYAEKLSVLPSTYASYLDRLREIGTDAWNLLFDSRGGDEQGTSERISEFVAALDEDDGARIQIVHSGNVRAFIFPWSLLYPPNTSPVEPLRFWGARFQIEQVTGSRGPDPRLNEEPVSVGFALDRKFANSETQTTMFADYRTRAVSKLDVSDPVSSKDGLIEQLTRDPAPHLLYFFCHGYAAGRRDGLRPDGVKRLKDTIEKITDSAQKHALETLLDLTTRMNDESWIFVGDAEVKESTLVAARFFERRRPIVFLNMCQSADLLPSMADGFVRLFLKRNAAAVLGTESPMTAVFAAAFAKTMFDALFSGKDVGTALLATRRHFLGSDQRNPLGLAYTLYGRATAKVGAKSLLPTT